MATQSKGWRGRGGSADTKFWEVIRHGHGPRRGCNAVSKAIETQARQAAKKVVREALRNRDVD